MNKLMYVLVAMAMISCSSESKQDYVKELLTERDSLKKEYQKIGKNIGKIELQLAKLDTSRRMVHVTITEAEHQSFTHYFKVYGSINADNNTMIYPSASGEIKAIRVEEGQPVTKGQVLLTIDSDILLNNIEEVKTQQSLAKDVYHKQKNLWDQNIGSEMDYLRAKNNLEALDKKIVTLETQLSKSNVTAPFSGTIDAIFVKSGQMVSPQMVTMRIINLDKVYLKSEIPESYISVIGKGSRVKLHFPSIDVSIDTEIEETGKFINPANRTFTVRVNLDNDNSQYYPNLLGMLEIQDYGNDSALVVPARLVQEDASGNSFLFVVEKTEGLAKSMIRKIKVGMTSKGITEVISGLKAQDLIIDQGARNVSNGQLIDIIK